MKQIEAFIVYILDNVVVRYIIGGGTSACVNLSTLYVFHYFLGVHYIIASIIAFVLAFFVSLFFHKFWTFRERSRGNLRAQGRLYLISSLFGLGLNTLILYLLVSIGALPVLLAQIIAGALVASCTFFISKYFIFTA